MDPDSGDIDAYSFTYTYDKSGNLVSWGDLNEPFVLSYEDGSWRDLLTAFNGHTITYDAIGNPTEWYNGTRFTWANGRQLTSAEGADFEAYYTYNTAGLRMTKTVNGLEHKYIWQGDKLISEQQYYEQFPEQHPQKELEFFYDESGKPYAMSYKENANAAPRMYYYVTNLQGDILSMVDADGFSAAEYYYSAYGLPMGSSGEMADINPLRYRGYYFDTETGLYYLKSRYYDPAVCRFINADDAETLISGLENIAQYNLFAYCFNNPVNLFDDTGTWPSWTKKVVAAVAVVAVVAAVAAITVATAGAGTAAAVIAIGAAKGTAIGMLTGAAIGAGTGAITHRISTGSWSGAGIAALNGMGDGALSGAITGAVTGAASSAIKVSSAAKAWDSGTFKSEFQSMRYHYNKHVLNEGMSKGNNVLKYTQDAVGFANRNSSVLKYSYNFNYGNASWNLTYSTGQGGMFTSGGKILTFWYR